MKSPTSVEVYLGIPDARPDYVQACRDLGAPIMISASAFAQPWTTAMREASIDHPGFKAPPSDRFAGMKVALDGMGFTAMRLWGGYPVTPDQYFHDLARRFAWSFWSSQDLCCEPEISSSAEETRTFIYSFTPPSLGPSPGATIALDASEFEDAGIRKVLQTPGEAYGAWSILDALLALTGAGTSSFSDSRLATRAR